jgi:hypothetical protein
VYFQLVEKGLMQDESSTFGLSREKLSKLWKIGKVRPHDKDDLNKEQEKAELLQNQLAESLPLDAGIHHLLPNILTVVCEKLKPFTGCSLKDLLLDPETDPLVLKTIKDIHKKQAESAPLELEQEVAIAVYYVTIASALVHYDVKITKLPYRDLSQSFDELCKSNWLPLDLKNLLGEAHRLCIRHVNKLEK